MTDGTATEELVITRIFDAPRELVYRAFIDPDQLAAWFGPVGWSVPRDTVSVEARAGGQQKFVMVNDEDPSQTSPITATFLEIVENELIMGVEDVEGIPGMEGTTKFTMRAEFHDEGDGRTRLVLRQGPYTKEMRGMAQEGWLSSFTKLDKLLVA